MADNVDVTPGTGATIAADDVGGVLYQTVKIAVGPNGVASLLDNANPLPVNDAGGSLTVDGTVGISGTVSVTADGGSITVDGALTDAELRATPVPVADGGGSLTVDGTVAVTDGGGSLTVDGTFWQATQPVSDAGGSLTVDGTVAVTDGGGSLTVDGTVTVDDGGSTISVDDGGGSLTIDGTVSLTSVAHDAADSGNPIKIGARARSSEISAVSNNDRSDLLTDLVGKLLVLPYSNPENFVSGAITSAMTGTTSTSLVAAPASGLRNYITTIVCSNAHATVGTDIIIQDGSGGTTLMTIPAAVNYGGAVISLPVPLRQPTTATALCCANVTTGASTKVSAVGYKGV